MHSKPAAAAFQNKRLFREGPGVKLISAVFVALLAFSSIPNATYAAETQATYQFNLPEQSLSEALKAIGQQTTTNILFDPESVLNKTAPALRATLTASEAIDRVLQGTNLTSRQTTADTVLVQPLTKTTQTNNSSLRHPGAEDGRSSDEGAKSERGRPLVFAQTQTGSQTESQAEGTATSTENRAAPALEEIVVTAEKREESIQDLPIAISAYSGETLTQRGIEGLRSLQQLAPSLQINVWSGQKSLVAMRGVSSEVLGTEPAVAMSRDGVSYADPGLFTGDFFDSDRVEVLRGPQGTISGRNATAGAINIHSNRPTDEFEGGIKATVANYDRLGLEGFLSGPIAGDRLLGRLAVRTDRADGWMTNTLRGDELGTIDKVIARGSFLARLTDHFEASLILEGVRDRSVYLSHPYTDVGRLRPDTPTLTEALGIPGFDWDDRTVQLDEAHTKQTEQYQTTLRLAWDLGPSAQLTAITGYVDQATDGGHDGDGTAESFTQDIGIGETWDTAQVSQEVTLTMDLTDRLDMLLGALYLHLDSQLFSSFGIPVVGIDSIAIDRDANLTSWAGYTQWRYRLTDEIRLTAGVRYTHDSKDQTEGTVFNGTPLPPVDNDGTWNAWTPRFAVDYAPSDNLTLYGSVSRGFKSGGLEGATTFSPEYVWNYEAGAKASWLDGRLKTALTGFYMDYTDLQQRIFSFDQAQGRIINQVINAKSASIPGVELELDALLTDRLRFTLAGTWLDGTYDELRDVDPLFPELGAPLPEAPDGPNFRDLSGNRLVRSAEWQFNASGEYTVPLGGNFLGGDLQGVLRASYAWQDRVYYDIFNRNATSQAPYGLINLFGAIETTDGRWQLSAFVRNLTDEPYFTHKIAVIGLGPVPYPITWVGEPSRYGISFARRF